MFQIVLVVAAFIFVVWSLCCGTRKSEKDPPERPRERHRIVKESEKATIERPGTQLTDDEIEGLAYLQWVSAGCPVVPISGRNPRLRGGKIILYHYTTYNGACGIRREKLIKSSDENTQQQHRRYGCGVYFTSYSPHDLEPKELALNCFTNGGREVISRGIYRKTRYVVKIEFHPHEVQKLPILYRDVYIFRGSIYLYKFVGRYEIYENPKHPYDLGYGIMGY